jgi:hypothetical protein
LKPDGGGSAPARNFTKIEQEPWKAKRILPYEVRCREEAPPELREDGTILIRSLGSYALVIHPEGDNIKIPEAN